ncbi:MAG TPA: hypothetical protein VFQ61_39145 [Polyangiaceae bacterium]|nr:hypothetical protein [Polyangiaceae bacterium]
MRKVWLVWAAAVLLGASGCFLIQGRAELVKRDKAGGVLALKGDRNKAMEDAKRQMSANCPEGYEIVGEEMAKVGETTEAAEDAAFGKKSASKSSTSVTTDVKEYRITYSCNRPE